MIPVKENGNRWSRDSASSSLFPSLFVVSGCCYRRTASVSRIFLFSSNETRIRFFHEGADDYKCNKVQRGGANSPLNWKVSKWIGVYDVGRNQ